MAGRLLVFVPLLAICYQRYSLLQCLWISALIGLIFDLLIMEQRFGVYSICYTLTTLIAYRHKHNFFEDKPLALSLYASFISCLFSCFQLASHLFGSAFLPLTPRLILTDLFLMPLCDGIYAFLWFTCPLALYTYIKKVGIRRLLKLKT